MNMAARPGPVMAAEAGLVMVAHIADHSAPTTALVDFLRWATRSGRAPEGGLRAVCWRSGPSAPAMAGTVPTVDVGRAMDLSVANKLERMGVEKVAGGLRGRLARRALAPLSTGDIVYLNTGFAGWCLRYLPAGHRRIVTHLHELDRHRAQDLLPADRDRLVAATTTWLATSEDLALWAQEEFGIDVPRLTVQPPVIDPTGEPVDATSRGERRRRLGLGAASVLVGVAGSFTWRDGPDHTGRVVAALARRRPQLDLHLLWVGRVEDDRQLWPMEGEIRRAGGTALVWDRPGGRPFADLDLADLVVVTSADHRDCSAIWTAAAHAVPLVCFDTHRMAGVAADGGAVIRYPDADDAAAAVLALLDQPGQRRRLGQQAQARATRERGGDTVGARLLDRVLQAAAAPTKGTP